MSTSVVFGGAGFIGTHLVRRLVERGERVLIADIERPANAMPTGVEFVHCDVRSAINLSVGACSVFNLAAVHRTPGHAEHEYYETNALGAVNVARFARESESPSVVFTSSISVYGASEERKSEDSELQPNSSYGRSKRIAEEIHHAALQGSAASLHVFRPAVIFGAGEHGNFTRLAEALARKRFVYPGRRDTVKGCGYVSDLVDAMLFRLDGTDRSTTDNFCYPVNYTIEEICSAFDQVAGTGAPKSLPPSLIGWSRTNAAQSAPGIGHLAQRLQKLVNSTDIAPARLQEAGFVWRTTLVTALQAWFDQTERTGFR